MFTVLVDRAPGHQRTACPHWPWLAPTNLPEPIENGGQEAIAPTGWRNALPLRLNDERLTSKSGSAGRLADGRGLNSLFNLPLVLLRQDPSSICLLPPRSLSVPRMRCCLQMIPSANAGSRMERGFLLGRRFL